MTVGNRDSDIGNDRFKVTQGIRNVEETVTSANIMECAQKGLVSPQW